MDFNVLLRTPEIEAPVLKSFEKDPGVSTRKIGNNWNTIPYPTCLAVFTFFSITDVLLKFKKCIEIHYNILIFDHRCAKFS